MGLFDQDDIPIISSILGNGNGGSNLPSARGLNNYGAGDRYGGLDPYSTGAQPIPTDVSGATAQFIPPATGTPQAVPVASPTPNAATPTPNATPAVGGAQPSAPTPVGAPMAPGQASLDPATKAGWLGHAFGATSPQQGQNIASQFLSGLGTGMRKALGAGAPQQGGASPFLSGLGSLADTAKFANAPAGTAALAGFGAGIQAAQRQGAAQQQMEFKAHELAQRQQQQQFMQNLLTRKQGFAETNAAHTDQIKRLDAATRALEGQSRAGMYDAHGQYYLDHNRWQNGKTAWELTVPGREHQIQQDAARQFVPRRNAIEQNYRADFDKEARDQKIKDLEAEQNAYIEDQRKRRGVDPKNITQGTAESPHAPGTQVEIDGMPAGSIYKAPSDGKRQDGTSYKKGDLMVRGGDKFNSDAPPAPPPAAPVQTAPQSAPGTQAEAEPQNPGPSDEEIIAALGNNG